MDWEADVSMRPIAVVRNGFPEKFGVPRQSGLIGAEAEIVFRPDVPFESFREIEEFSHLWIIWQFHQVTEEQTRWRVRPPRLGGNTFRGVFSTRAPFRPNRLGLSVVELMAVETDRLRVRGLDVVDGTPVFDVKPYLAFCEAIPGAKGGFADEAPVPLVVEVAEEVKSVISSEKLAVIREILALDARPAYHEDPERVYESRAEGFVLRWRVAEGGKVQLLEATKGLNVEANLSRFESPAELPNPKKGEAGSD